MPAPKKSLGFDNYAVRSLGWKASQLVDYAASLRVDALMLSDFDVYESLAAQSLKDLRKRASDQGLQLYAGMLSACPGSVIFDPRRGDAVAQLRLCLRIAAELGSPVARCVLGRFDDRRSQGGIRARISELVKVLRQVRQEALDRGIVIAVENHAGDLQAHELAALIEETGRDFVGATLDTGNAPWALEDPRRCLEILGPHVLCTGIRDSVIWETPHGAAFEWCAIGEGQTNWADFLARFQQLCPQAPFIVETISARRFDVPFLLESFWQGYEDTRGHDLASFIALARKGKQPPSQSQEVAQAPEFQRAQLEQSLRYCREVLGLGKRA